VAAADAITNWGWNLELLETDMIWMNYYINNNLVEEMKERE